ncbi:MAG TPA: DNA-3-methyladenine glycosylase I [Dehalococcoidia bacterium]|nr:DNA-3-methyladenine glycosylase I [Dehalococcoidia bacterium]
MQQPRSRRNRSHDHMGHRPRSARDRGAPPQVQVNGLSDYLEVMSKSVFQTGMSWDLINKKWPGTREAMHGFDVEVLANLPPWEIDQLMTDTRVIRNRRKLEAIVQNAQQMIELDIAHGGFRNYLRSHADYDALEKDIRKRFRFMGEMGIYSFVYTVGEPVPEFHEWAAARGKHFHAESD